MAGKDDKHEKKHHDKNGKKHDDAANGEGSAERERLAALAQREGDRLLENSAPKAPAIAIAGISFDLDDPHLAPEVDDAALKSGGYPYDKRLKEADYDAQLLLLQIELVKLQLSVVANKQRLLILFEGRDAAGKGGTIDTFREYMNPRVVRTVALSKPSDTEQGQWYFQRYIEHLPTAGEIVLFDRSWYNRAGVERVMGFATPAEVEAFLDQAPRLEKLLADDGIVLVKFWLDIGREMELKRFFDRRHDPLKVSKLSPVDIKALDKWDAYSAARDEMIRRTHSPEAPWTIVRANDKRRTHLNAIRYVLRLVDYEHKSLEAIGDIDPEILGLGPGFRCAD